MSVRLLNEPLRPVKVRRIISKYSNDVELIIALFPFIDDEEKGQMELLLRDAIKQAITAGDLSAKDWLKEPVPHLFVTFRIFRCLMINIALLLIRPKYVSVVLISHIICRPGKVTVSILGKRKAPRYGQTNCHIW